MQSIEKLDYWRKIKSNSLSLNIILSFLSRVGGASIGFLIIPNVIQIINKDHYGIYLSIISFLLLTQILDFGVNNIIKNKISGHIAKQDYIGASSYYTNAYIFIFAVAIVLSISAYSVHYFNSNLYYNIFPLIRQHQEWKDIIFLVTCFALLNFLSLPGINLLYCLDKTYLVYFLNFLGQLIGFLLLIQLSKFSLDKLYLTVICIYGVPYILNAIAVLYFQCKRSTLVRFKLIYFRLRDVRRMLKESAKFFIIQVASVVQFQLSNYLVSVFFLAQQVTEYNAYSKYFSIVQVLMTIITTPYWISFAKLHSSHDYTTLRREFESFRRYIYYISIILIVQFLVGHIVFSFWLSNSIIYNYLTAFFVMLYYLTFINGAAYVIFINSISLLNIQTYTSMISIVLFVGVFVFSSKYFGINSISFSLIIANFYGTIIAPIQVARFFKKKREILATQY